jgi:hypothetical protein
MQAVEKRKAKIAAELARADEKIASLRASEPKGERDPEKAARAAKSALFEPLKEARERVREAEKRLEETPKPGRFWPFNIRAKREMRAAENALKDAQEAEKKASPHYLDIDTAEGKARNAAIRTARAHAAWEAGPGKELRSLEHGVAKIREALENRDYRTRDALLNGGLEAALELIRKREAEERRKREIEAARAAKRGNVYGFPDRQNSGGMEMPAPRMR